MACIHGKVLWGRVYKYSAFRRQMWMQKKKILILMILIIFNWQNCEINLVMAVNVE